MSASTVPIFDPQGTVRDVPFEQMQAAVAAGGKPAILVKPPDSIGGAPRYVPTDQMSDAVKAGGTILPIQDQDTQHPGFWHALVGDLVGMGKGLISPTHHENDTGESIAAKATAPAQAEQSAGYSVPYRAAAALARGTGIVDPSAMEQSAVQGDVAGVAGHATAPIAALAASEGVAHGAPALAEAAPAALSAAAPVIRTAAKATNMALEHAPGLVGAAAGELVGHPIVGYAMGRALLPKVQIPGENFGLTEPTYPGAPLPETPPAEVMQAKGLATGGQPAVEPSKALGELPVHAVHQAIQELGPQATIPALTERANNIAKLGDLLNQGLGGKALEPNIPIKNQGGVITPKASEVTPSASVPEGHTPVDSSALKSYKYDPSTREFEVMTQGGGGYVHGDISPDQAKAFEDAPSKGKAWQSIRQNGTLVAKIINGKRIPVKPVISDEDLISDEEREAAEHLYTGVEGTPK